MATLSFVIVHPDSQVIPDDGGCFRELGLPVIVHRDPSASIPDLVAESTAGILFAAQLDSDLPNQVCHLLASSGKPPFPSLFFWGPGINATLLEGLWNSGVRDCFSDRSTPQEVLVRIKKQLQEKSFPANLPNIENIAARYNRTVRDLAHDLKNPLCILHGYAQMAQMGQPITPSEAADMLSSSREICEMIDNSLKAVGPEFFAEPVDLQAKEQAS